MSTLEELLEGRFATSDSTKVKALAKKSATGSLTGFHGIFKPQELLEQEKALLEELLSQYSQEGASNIRNDLQALINITSEVKAINTQAAILHGERIMAAQKILKSYREGAFSAWLIATYGNRQTPYNFLLYYQFYLELPEALKSKLEHIPKQAVYTLASRNAPFEKKRELVSSYAGQSKREMLELIRSKFPLATSDKRRSSELQNLLISLERLISRFQLHESTFDTHERKALLGTLRKFLFFVEKSS